jgi:hypothetical protein
MRHVTHVATVLKHDDRQHDEEEDFMMDAKGFPLKAVWVC